MSTYPKLNNETELLKIKVWDDEIKNLNYQMEKDDHENKFKTPKNDNECYKKK